MARMVPGQLPPWGTTDQAENLNIMPYAKLNACICMRMCAHEYSNITPYTSYLRSIILAIARTPSLQLHRIRFPRHLDK
jgi:hypothetical protein